MEGSLQTGVSLPGLGLTAGSPGSFGAACAHRDSSEHTSAGCIRKLRSEARERRYFGVRRESVQTVRAVGKRRMTQVKNSTSTLLVFLRRGLSSVDGNLGASNLETIIWTLPLESRALRRLFNIIKKKKEKQAAC